MTKRPRRLTTDDIEFLLELLAKEAKKAFAESAAGGDSKVAASKKMKSITNIRLAVVEPAVIDLEERMSQSKKYKPFGSSDWGKPFGSSSKGIRRIRRSVRRPKGRNG